MLSLMVAFVHHIPAKTALHPNNSRLECGYLSSFLKSL